MAAAMKASAAWLPPKPRNLSRRRVVCRRALDLPIFTGRAVVAFVGAPRPRLCGLTLAGRWGAIAIVAPVLVEKGVAAGYGYPHASRSIFFPEAVGSVENVLAYISAAEAYDDLAEYLKTELSGSTTGTLRFPSPRSPLEDSVTRISSDGVFQGSSNLS